MHERCQRPDAGHFGDGCRPAPRKREGPGSSALPGWAALDEQKQKIIAECDAREKSESDAAARAAEEGNAAALAALETQRSQAAEAMTAAAKAHEAEWCAALVQRTLGGEAAQ